MATSNGAVVAVTEKQPENLPVQFSAWDSPANFETAQRMAKMLSVSTMIPERYRNNIGDCVIAMEMARRIGANVLSVMQNLYVVYGSPAWSSQFLVACVNASKRFTPLRYRMTGKKGDDTWGCVAWAKDGAEETLESPEVTIGIAKAEGWFGKKGSKWQTMPELMLRYRAATLFARLYAPELTMGIRTDDEVVDITPIVTEPKFNQPLFKPSPIDIETPVPKLLTGELPANDNSIADLRAKCKAAGISEAVLIDYLFEVGSVNEKRESFEEIALEHSEVIAIVCRQWDSILTQLQNGKAVPS